MEEPIRDAAVIDVPLCPFIREANYAIRSPWVLPDRRLLDYLLVVVERGTCRFVVEDRPYLLIPGQVFLAQPGDRLTLEGLTDTVTPYLHCDIVDQPGRDERFSPGPGFLDLAPYRHLVQPRLDDLLHVTLPPVVVPADPGAFRDQLITCIGLWQTGTALNRLEAHVLLSGLFVKILRAHLADAPLQPRVPSILRPLDAFLRHHLHEQISVQMMADHVGFSVPHLNRLCHQYWQQTPHQRLLHLRLQHSLLLLQNVDLSIAQIARYCGFADTQHFVHVFRKHLGSTPTRARATGTAGLARGQPVGRVEDSRRIAPSPLTAREPGRHRRDGATMSPCDGPGGARDSTRRLERADAWPRPASPQEQTHGTWQIVGTTTPRRDR